MDASSFSKKRSFVWRLLCPGLRASRPALPGSGSSCLSMWTGRNFALWVMIMYSFRRRGLSLPFNKLGAHQPTPCGVRLNDPVARWKRTGRRLFIQGFNHSCSPPDPLPAPQLVEKRYSFFFLKISPLHLKKSSHFHVHRSSVL